MSLLPYMLDDSYLWPSSRLLDQRFGLNLVPEDLLQPLIVPRSLRSPAGDWRSAICEQDTGSTVTYDKNEFQAIIDVQQFRPEEITVKATGDNTVTIEGKHEEKQDEHGQIYRHFVRKYTLPEDCDMDKLESKLSSDGVLSITAPRKGETSIEHKSIPVTQTGQPAKAIQKSCKKTEEKRKMDAKNKL